MLSKKEHNFYTSVHRSVWCRIYSYFYIMNKFLFTFIYYFTFHFFSLAKLAQCGKVETVVYVENVVHLKKGKVSCF